MGITRSRAAELKAAKERVPALFAEGVSLKNMAKELGVTKSTVVRWCKQMGYRRTKGWRKRKARDLAQQMHRDGYSLEEIIRETKESRTNVRAWLRPRARDKVTPGIHKCATTEHHPYGFHEGIRAQGWGYV